MTQSLSIILPAKNEAENLRTLLPKIREHYPDVEVLVVNDGSGDATDQVCADNNARVIRHSNSMGNGASIKSGARAARGDRLVFMDADGQHDPDDIPRLIEGLDKGNDMVVGARSSVSQANTARRIANAFYNWFASWMTNQKIQDLTCGFRAVKAQKFREFLHLLPNGFSYPTTITMAFFRVNYPILYIPITAGKRQGKSHINLFRDGLRFSIIIFKVATLFSPLKVFIPVSAAFFLTGFSYYMYTFINHGRFTNMSALLFTTSVIIFLIGLVSEQITFLAYKDTGRTLD